MTDFVDPDVRPEFIDPDAPTQKPKRGMWSELGRQLGLTARYGLEGGLMLPEVVGNAVGLPRPENAQERVVGDVTRALAGVGGLNALGKLMAGAVSPVARGIGSVLESAPGMQAASAVTGSAAGGSVREGGGGTGAQMGASLIASMIPPVASFTKGSLLSAMGPRSVDPERARLAQVAATENIPLDAAQKTGSKPLQTINAVFEQLPFTAGKEADKQDATRRAFTAAVLKRAGIDSAEATPEVLQGRKTSLGSTFEEIATKNPLVVGGDLVAKLNGIKARASDLLTDENASAVSKVVDRILADAEAAKVNPLSVENRMRLPSEYAQSTGQMPGTKYQDWRTELYNLGHGNDRESMFYKQIKKELDNAYRTGLSGEQAATWDAASRDYANLKTILQARGGSGQIQAGSTISPAQLDMANISSMTKEGKALGRGDLTDLAKLGQLFVRDQVGNPGTAQRAMWQNILTGGYAGSVAGSAFFSPMGALGLAALPKTAQMAINSKLMQEYLASRHAASFSPAVGPTQLNALLQYARPQ